MRTVLISILIIDSANHQITRQESIEVAELPDELAGRMVGSIERLAELLRDTRPPDGGNESRVAVGDDNVLECCNVSGHHSRCTVYGRDT